jgi:hypothetical protein
VAPGFVSWDSPAEPDVLDLATLVGDDGELGLADLLASARELAQAAQGSEDRSRLALYAAIGRAHDFALAAAAFPQDLAELIEDAGLKAQERAPMVPLLKLVFGVNYDKTRLAEFATALNHADRLGLAAGMLAPYLAGEPGGLKGVVQRERELRRAESGAAKQVSPREAVAVRLKKFPTRPLSALSPVGEEFTLVVARRLPDGQIVLIGEVADDVGLLERAAKRIAR